MAPPSPPSHRVSPVELREKSLGADAAAINPGQSPAIIPGGTVKPFFSTRSPRRQALIEACGLAFLLTLAVGLIGTGHFILDLKDFRQAQQQQETSVITRAGAVLQEKLAAAVSDTRLLAQIVQQVGVPASLGDARTRILGEYFKVLGRERPMYDQVRLLSYPGHELVRVNQGLEGPEIVSRQNLQDKSKRYYFLQARDLAEGEIYISPVDLNIEWGKSEAVPRPMFRVATPVFDDGGHRRGVVLVNYRGEALAAAFKDAMGDAANRLMVLDQRGFWISNPRQELEWGFAFDPDARFQNHYPAVWQQMEHQATGTLVNHRGIFSFLRLNSDIPASVASLAPPPWYIVSLFPGVLLRQSLGLGSYISAYGLMAIVVLLLAAGYGAVRSRQLHAADRLGQFEPLAGALKNSANPVIATDTADRLVFVNDATLVYSGYVRSNLLGQSRIDMLVAPAMGEQCRTRLRELVAGKREPGQLAAGLYDRNGSNYRLAWAESLQHDASGTLSGVVYIGGVPRQELPQDDRLRSLATAIEQSPVSVMITDTDGHIEYVNSCFNELTGYASEEVLGNKPSILKSGKTPLEDYRQLWANLKAGREWQGIFHNRKKNGELYVETARISPLRDEAGEVTHYLAVKEDITERTRLERNFQLAVEAAPSAMVLSNSKGMIVLVNSRTEQMFGYSREEMLGQPIEMLVPDETRPRHAGLRLAYQREPRARPMGSGEKLRGERRDGHQFPVDIGLNPIETDEGVMVLSSIIDLTEQEVLKHKLEERNRQIVEAHALATVGRMAAMVAHDLRNPLSSVKMGLQILSRSQGKETSDGDQELHGIALEQVYYMENILNELLAYSQPVVLKGEWFDINKAIERVILLCQGQFQQYQPQLTSWSEPSLPTVYGDPHRLQQALSNLIANSIEACAEAGIPKPQVSVRAHLDLSEEAPLVCIEVIDNGPGLDAETSRHVFDPFFTSRAKGTGLGLTIVRQIIAAHGGIITLENEPGGGARASITLPTRPQGSSAEVPDGVVIPPAETDAASELPQGHQSND